MVKKTILVVEDEAEVRAFIRDAFVKEYNVLEASRCSEAQEQFTKTIDLLLLDYLLPDGDGFEVLRKARELKPQLPVIMITGHGTEDLAIRALKAGVTDYIKKPLGVVYLMSKVSCVLEEESPGGGCKSGSGRSKREFILDEVRKYIEENYREDLTLDELSKMAGMDRFSFCKCFKEGFGKGFRSYLNEVRIGNAAELLRNEELSVAEVAFSVGYRGTARFSRAFKERYGVSPMAYRRSLGRKTDNKPDAHQFM